MQLQGTKISNKGQQDQQQQKHPKQQQQAEKSTRQQQSSACTMGHGNPEEAPESFARSLRSLASLFHEVLKTRNLKSPTPALGSFLTSPSPPKSNQNRIKSFKKCPGQMHAAKPPKSLPRPSPNPPKTAPRPPQTLPKPSPKPSQNRSKIELIFELVLITLFSLQFPLPREPKTSQNPPKWSPNRCKIEVQKNKHFQMEFLRICIPFGIQNPSIF